MNKNMIIKGITTITLMTITPIVALNILSEPDSIVVKADQVAEKDFAFSTNEPTVKVGTDEAKVSNVNSGNSLKIDGNNEESSLIYDPTLFVMYSAAKNYASGAKDLSQISSAGTVTEGEGTDAAFVKPGKYIQVISYKIPDFNSLSTSDATDSYKVTINGNEATSIQSDDLSSSLFVPNQYVINQTTGTLSIFRMITVRGDIKNNLNPIEVTIGDSSMDSILEETYNLSQYGLSVFKTGTPETVYYNDNPVKNPDSKEVFDTTKDDPVKGTYYRYVNYPFGFLQSSKLELFDLGDNITKAINATTNKVSGLKLVQKVNFRASKDATPSIKDLSVTAGTATTDESLTNTDDDQLKDGDTVLATKPTTDGNYYLDDPTATDTSKIKTDLNTAGTYYRKLTFNLDKDTAGEYNFDNGNEVVKSDGSGSEITYIQKITVKEKPKTSSSSSKKGWTINDQKGVVTTKNKQAYYTLNNTDNKVVSNRALAKNTSWYTDKSRVDQFGNVQYHVSTDEWINADEVIFSADDNVLNNIENVNDTLYVDSTRTYYSLYTKNNQLVDNRALAKNTYWKVDQIAQNSNGTKFYRVSTDESVEQVAGVHYGN